MAKNGKFPNSVDGKGVASGQTKTVILDGYNVIHGIPELEEEIGDNLRTARDSLIMFMADWRNKHQGHQVVIVFDNKTQEGCMRRQHTMDGIKCCFTKPNENADDKIIEIVRCLPKPRDLIVVSGDNKVRNSCIALDAEIYGPSYLISEPTKGKDKRWKNDKKIPLGKVKEINESLPPEWKRC